MRREQLKLFTVGKSPFMGSHGPGNRVYPELIGCHLFLNEVEECGCVLLFRA